jgi:hypothetical protein
MKTLLVALRIREHRGWLSILSMFVAATVAAQDKPDFSGRWILVTSADAGPAVARSLTVRQRAVRTNVYGDPIPPFFKELTVERQFGNDVRTETYQIGIVGGMVGGMSPANGITSGLDVPQTRFSVRWEDNRLVIDIGNYSGPAREAGPFTEHEVWQIDAAGMLILSMAERGSGIPSTTKTLMYRKN